MNCDTCPHGFSPEDETCRHCPLYPEEKPATPTSNPVPTVEAPAPASPSAPAEEAGPEEIPPVLSLEDGKETAPYFPNPLRTSLTWKKSGLPIISAKRPWLFCCLSACFSAV